MHKQMLVNQQANETSEKRMIERAKQKLDTNTLAIDWNIGKGIGHTSTIISTAHNNRWAIITRIENDIVTKFGILRISVTRAFTGVRCPFTFVRSQQIRIDYALRSYNVSVCVRICISFLFGFANFNAKRAALRSVYVSV